MGSPSFSLRVFIIQYGRCTHPSSAMNSRTPACVEAAGLPGFRSLKTHGDSRSNCVRWASADGGRMTEGSVSTLDSEWLRLRCTFATVRDIQPLAPRKHGHTVCLEILVVRSRVTPRWSETRSKTSPSQPCSKVETEDVPSKLVQDTAGSILISKLHISVKSHTRLKQTYESHGERRV